MGGSTKDIHGLLKFNLPFDFANDLKIYKDGQLFTEFKHNFKKNLEVDICEPGTFRAEVHISNSKFKNLPWITTNPIFINKNISDNPPEKVKNHAPTNKTLDLSTDLINDFSLESNKKSTASLLKYMDTEQNPIAQLKFHLRKERGKKDFWVALAYRSNINFTGFSGVSFSAYSDKKMRYWFEVRTSAGDDREWFKYSFQADNQWRNIYIPFNQLYNSHGKKLTRHLENISSLFFSLNNGISYHNVSGELKIKQIKLVN